VKLRDAAAAGAIALAAALCLSLPYFRVLEGLSVDALFWLRHKTFGPIHAPKDSPAVVLAIDEETYRREPFAGTPQALWTPQLAQVLNAVLAAGAKVVGFDVIFPTSVENLVRGYDRDFLLALRRGANEGRVVLGLAQHQAKPISPFAGQSFAVGHKKNIRALNLFEDDDGIIRRAPLTFQVAGEGGMAAQENAMAVELAVRTAGIESGTLPRPLPDGAVEIAGYRVPPGEPNTLLINFNTGPGDIPAYSFADIHACVAQGKTDYLERHFKGRVVLLGTTLDVEDRKLTSKRWVTEPEGVGLPERCALPIMPGLYRTDFGRDSIPGVFIHATAINNILNRDALAPLTAWRNFLIALALAGMIAAAAMMLPFSGAGAALVALALAWAALATFAFHHGIVLPLFQGLASAGLAFPLLVGFRFAVTDRDRRQLGRAFSLYLPKAEIDRMVASGTQPQLGGEARTVSVLFSDIAGFTGISEKRSPVQLVADLNEYFGAMTAIVEEHGGFVDKFIGDAVVAVFGAPLHDPRHAENAVRAAMKMRDLLNDPAERLRIGDGVPIRARIGVNTGPVLVGNIGSPRRFNYTVMGDAVNLASRLEGVNKKYGTQIVVSEDTAKGCGETVEFREVDRVRVAGRAQPVGLFEPLAPKGAVEPQRRAALEGFSTALKEWRAGNFTAAAEAFARIAPADAVAAKFAERARAMKAPPPGWDGVTELTEK
jgi:adenylate cyclase